MSDQKHVLGTVSSNASGWGNQLIKKNKVWCHTSTHAFLRPFSPYNDIITQNLEGYPRIKVEGHNVHHLRYSTAVLIRHL